MSKGNNIKWRKEDRKKISNLVRTFNSKITRTLKAHPELAEFLPEKINVQDLTSSIKTRQDFNRVVKSNQRFMKKGAEAPVMNSQGVKTTKWEKKEVALKVAQINRARTNERKKADVSTYKGTMGTIENNNLLPKTFNFNKMKPKEWEKYIQTVNNQIQSTYYDEKMEKYKLNYLKAIENIFGDAGGEIIDIVTGIPAEKLMRMYYDDPVLQIDFVYDPLELQTIKENIIDHLKA